MGIYINIGNEGFKSARRGEYVDKSGLIAVINSTIGTEHSCTCVSRCRRFGKSMAAKMLYAYYDQWSDSRALFSDLKIAADRSFEAHLNKYPVIFLDISDFVTRFQGDDIVKKMDTELKEDIQRAYPDIELTAADDLMSYLIRIAGTKRQQFIFIIDEWDAICREFLPGTKAMDHYVNWLRRLFKGGQSAQVFAAVYMTGILPIKKYKTQSAMNRSAQGDACLSKNFIEYSMVKPGQLAGYFGFTREEVKSLSERHGMDFDEMEKWYDGYQRGDQTSIFNPNSVMQAIYHDYCESYWGSTGAFETVADYIQMNFDGLKDDIIRMLAGERCKVDPTMFGNDMSVINCKDDVLTVLIHLGYLSYDRRRRECFIPNFEVAGEMANAVKSRRWKHVAEALEASERLLQATIEGDEEAVARGIAAAHDEHTSILSYNDENSLACVLSIAYYYARNDYVMHRERLRVGEQSSGILASGKGFADIVLIPRKAVDSPAIVLELKCDKDADSAIEQIRRKQYTAKVEQYAGGLLLVGINYDRGTKEHSCRIEKR